MFPEIMGKRHAWPYGLVNPGLFIGKLVAYRDSLAWLYLKSLG